MQTRNIECQIAQAQLKRYLTGEELPYALVADLEAHLKNCYECMAVAQAKRESLKGVLASEITGRKATQPTPKPTPKREELKKAISAGVAAVQSPADVLGLPDSEFKIDKTTKKTNNSKTIVYSVGLAALLVLMSTVFKDPTTLFGPRAASIQKHTPPVEESAPGVPIVDEPVTEAPKLTETTDHAEKPAPTVSETAPVSERQAVESTKMLETDGFIVADSVEGTKVLKKDPTPSPKPAAPKASKPKPANPSTNTIKVYPPISK